LTLEQRIQEYCQQEGVPEKAGRLLKVAEGIIELYKEWRQVRYEELGGKSLEEAGVKFTGALRGNPLVKKLANKIMQQYRNVLENPFYNRCKFTKLSLVLDIIGNRDMIFAALGYYGQKDPLYKKACSLFSDEKQAEATTKLAHKITHLYMDWHTVPYAELHGQTLEQARVPFVGGLMRNPLVKKLANKKSVIQRHYCMLTNPFSHDCKFTNIEKVLDIIGNRDMTFAALGHYGIEDVFYQRGLQVFSNEKKSAITAALAHKILDLYLDWQSITYEELDHRSLAEVGVSFIANLRNNPVVKKLYSQKGIVRSHQNALRSPFSQGCKFTTLYQVLHIIGRDDILKAAGYPTKTPKQEITELMEGYIDS